MSIITTESQQSAWAKIKFFYQHTLSSLVATYTAEGYDANNLYSMFEWNIWKSSSANDQYITFAPGANYAADYFILANHNLYDCDALLTLQYSNDNFSADVHDAFTAFTPASNDIILKEFTQISQAYWRIKLTSLADIPFIGMAIWGSKTELDYASSSFDPHAEENKSIVNVSDTGYLLGIHEKYIERQIELSFEDADDTLYAKVKAWHDFVGLKNFFMAWETSQHPTDIYIVRSDPKWRNPIQPTGVYRDIKLSLRGRK